MIWSALRRIAKGGDRRWAKSRDSYRRIPKDPAVLKTVRDSELLRRSVFLLRPPDLLRREPLFEGQMSAIPRKMASALGVPR